MRETKDGARAERGSIIEVLTLSTCSLLFRAKSGAVWRGVVVVGGGSKQRLMRMTSWLWLRCESEVMKTRAKMPRCEDSMIQSMTSQQQFSRRDILEYLVGERLARA